jgi:membrane-associated phospholipid phosphatase
MRRASAAAVLLLVSIAATAHAQVQPFPRNLFNPDRVGMAPVAPPLSIDAVDAAALFEPPPQQPPARTHTGFQALVRSTGADFAAFPRRTSTWVILAVGAGGAALAHPADDSVNARLVGNRTVSRLFAPGQYLGLGYVQLGGAVGTYLVGRYALPPDIPGTHTNKVSHLGFDLVRANILTQALTHGIKIAVRRDRPTGECCSFPSGHASTTFATAAVLERHLGVRFAWPTILIASYVATSRLHDNRHFLSDVVFGAALGTAAGWTVVGRHGRSDYALLPVPIHGGVMITLMRQPVSNRGGN